MVSFVWETFPLFRSTTGMLLFNVITLLVSQVLFIDFFNERSHGYINKGNYFQNTVTVLSCCFFKSTYYCKNNPGGKVWTTMHITRQNI